jgi:hypothetical protein
METIFVAIAIIFGIINMFSESNKKGKGKTTYKPVNNRPINTPSPIKETFSPEKEETIYVDLPNERDRTEKDNSLLQPSVHSTLGKIKPTLHAIQPSVQPIKSQLQPTKKRREHHKKVHSSISLSSQLTGQKVVEAIILSEMLGPPRALKPYEPIYKNKSK